MINIQDLRSIHESTMSSIGLTRRRRNEFMKFLNTSHIYSFPNLQVIFNIIANVCPWVSVHSSSILGRADSNIILRGAWSETVRTPCSAISSVTHHSAHFTARTVAKLSRPGAWNETHRTPCLANSSIMKRSAFINVRIVTILIPASL